ncbi:MAG: DNA polymerase III subunit alpha [Gammaproteobacteria bacterium]|nr:DNA polymerase III subunit alpha [Gammaproteobacteria bacterium]MCP5135777.1 DNA polymerase III subunit alpha [Gammaproteobacteria bacterium]
MSSPAFVHLHLHTEFSLVDGLVRVKPLVGAATAAGHPALALTDQANLFAAIKFYRSARGAGIKPIIGCELLIRGDDDADPVNRLVVLCRNQTGYMSLTRLISRSYRQGQLRGIATLHRSWLDGHVDGLIALSAGREGDVARALLSGQDDLAQSLAKGWSETFGGDYFLELIRTGRPQEEECLHASVALAGKLGLPVVATNDVRFLERDDFEAHEARVCIMDGRVLADPRRPRNYSEEQYLRTPVEMAELFADIPEALANTVEIARRCSLELVLDKPQLPAFPIPEGMTEDEFFIDESRKGLEERFQVLLDPDDPEVETRRKVYEERLEIELKVITQMGFPGYFLIVADFIQWAKDNDVPVGPGRGSGAGSLVAYALKITDLDPLPYDLLFERFLNPERVSMPDFDVDFCMDNRDKVINYVAEKYGRDKVSQIATHGSMAAKAVVRDVGRVMGHPYGFVDRIAKLIPFEIGITLPKAMEQEEDLRKLYNDDEDVRELLDMAMKLEGLARNVGKHAGGVVIAPTELDDFSPLYCEQGSEALVTQYDKDDVEAAGLVKFDFLGLRNLTIIKWAVEVINERRLAAGEDELDVNLLELDDPDVFTLLKEARTTAVFQLESRGMKEMMKRLAPDTFEDIVALVALYRPGPLGSGMVDDFINRKHGRQKVEYPHEDLKTILKPTYGTILYQEQVMQISQVLAGYSLGGADLLRRAMGKKKAEVMDQQRAIFVEGATGRGVDEATAISIFDMMAEFAKYGFNKSHSAAYALVSYQTAWLKSHYPAAYMAAVLSSDMDNTDKVVIFIEECRDMGLKVLPPNLNVSQYRFTVNEADEIVYGLGAIKGVGENAIEEMLATRKAGGVYTDLFDFTRRVDLRKVNKKVLEALIRAGAMDCFDAPRASLNASVADAVRIADQAARDADAGQVDLFGFAAEPEAEDDNPGLTPMPEWDEDKRLAAEKETLGLYLTGHPITRFLDELGKFTSGRLSALAESVIPDGSQQQGERGGWRQRGRKVVAAGLLIDIRVRQQRNGRMGILTLDDRGGRIEVKLFDEAFSAFQEILVRDSVIVVEGKLGYDDFAGSAQVTAERVMDIGGAREMFAKRMVLEINAINGADVIGPVVDLLAPHRGGQCPVFVRYRSASASAAFSLGEDWRIRPSDALMAHIQSLGEGASARLDY